jgi:alkanesulfonate monooxygenase SsuD/methylene tetrahydromethanopterin reductase-like flavin-dependent oxidoreductase (luciferase family)
VTRLGVVFRPQLSPERLHAVVRTADEAGLDDLWLWEDCFLESGIAAAGAALAWTSRIHIGVGLLPTPLRNVALTAMEIATLARLFPDRVEIGIGHGVQEWMGQVGERVASPLTLLREYGTALRSLLDGDTVTTAGRYVQLDKVALDWPPLVRARLWAGGVGPKTLAVCGDVADGTIVTSGTTPERVREISAIVRAAGGAEHEIVVYLIATDDEERYRREVVSWSLDPDDDVGVCGDAARIAAAVRRWADAGATRVILQPTVDEPDVEAFIRFIADEVRPLL